MAGIRDFEHIADSIHFHRPQARSDIKNGISLVVLCAWMGASRKHIAKYTEQYRLQEPGAEILVIESSLSDFVHRSERVHRNRLAAAREILLSHTDTGSVLLHAFSNGGAYSTIQLITSLPIGARTKAFKAVIFDSCPGTATYQQSANAVVQSLPKGQIAGIISIALAHFVLCFLFISMYISGTEDIITRIRRSLNNPELFSVHVPRLYLYSKTDRMVSYHDVHEHAHQARQIGYLTVVEKEFGASMHCAHAMENPIEYWEVVKNITVSQ